MNAYLANPKKSKFSLRREKTLRGSCSYSYFAESMESNDMSAYLANPKKSKFSLRREKEEVYKGSWRLWTVCRVYGEE